MDPVTVGICGIGVLLILFVAGVPVSYAMAIAGFIGFAYLTSFESALSMISVELFDNFGSYSLTVIPTFVLMGALAFSAGITGRLYDAGFTMFGRVRGGLAYASVAACAGFAAICGSTSATAASMGKVALPEMKKHGYDDSLSTGCIASAGTLGILIPPSTIFIIYGILTEQSIGKLFIAGVLPGLLLAALFCCTITYLIWRNPALSPPGFSTTLRQKLSGLSGLIETLVLFGLVMGGLFTGWFTATQAGAAGAASVLLIALARKRIGWSGILDAAKETVVIACMVLILVTGALIFGRFMAVTNLTFVLADWLRALPIPSWCVMGLIIVIHFIGGCFMDSFAMIVLTIPIVYPVVTALGYDPIWFGVLIVVICEMGVITPPVGLNLFVIKGLLPDVSIEVIIKGVTPFIFAIAVFTALMMLFPQIALFLPSFMTY
ncbi:MAG TPA: TRAP transporter large permease [Syntrophorhabdaceae bacterium]|nr:TRAP transporter large permease [Syntrophorhabdaceae bacterium]